MLPIEEARYWAKVDKTDSCWLWTASTQGPGYGQVKIGGRQRSAHRVSYEMHKGPIPAGLMIDHLCHVKRCVNPDHLQLATSKENQENKSGPSVRNKSGVRGVYWAPDRRKWCATVGHDGRTINAGRYDTLAEAEAAAIAKRNELHTNNLLDRKAA